MKNWFKKKSRKDNLIKALTEWFEEKEDKRAAFMVILDDDNNTTSCGVYGNGAKIVDAIVNECMQEEDVSLLLLEAVHRVFELKNAQEEESKVEEKPKRRRKKTEKVVS